MSITGMIMGVVMLVANPAEGIKKVYNGVQIYNKIQEKTERKEWSASLHEESHQIIKDTIKNLGQR